ncbi:MAG: TonB-dependent receptor [Rikenellaceae bacterium]
MRYRIRIFFTLFFACLGVAQVEASTASADSEVAAPQIDTLLQVDQVQVTTIKQGLNLKAEPVSVSILNMKEIENKRVTTMKDVSSLAPNFYIPDYGSRITSSIYVRGLGARIDQPVIGLNVDNVPYLNKNGFDVEVADIERVEILRGPQSTLYGRNTMGGVVNIYTLSPFNYQGVRVGLSYGSGNTYKINGSIYEKFSDKFAASLSGYYNSTDGFYTNEYTGENCDTERSAGGRLRMQYRASSRTRLDNTLSVSTVDQGGYAYKNLERGDISYNDPSSYLRTLVNNGLTVQHTTDKFKISSITSYQYLNDIMTLDQDFSPESVFTLQQKIQEHSVTQDFVLRNKKESYEDGYSWMVGAFGFYDHKNMQAPVTFKEAGINDLILENIPTSTDYYVWDSDSFLLDSDFTNHTFGTALYHESSYRWNRLKVTAGIRLDYEYTMLDYHSYTNTGAKKYNSDDELIFVKPINIDLTGKPNQSFLEFLPKINAIYQFGEYQQSTIYATISKGYKAGGYNSQMFSDILQQEITSLFGLSALYEAEDIISYKPEYSWNYEIGTHLENKNRTLSADLSLFYIDCRDQQLTIFPDGMVTGRMMTNAGRSRSYGAEFSGRATLGNFTINAAYGYTNAKFIEYDDNEEDYAGNYVPYAPQQTMSASIDYTIPLNRGVIKNIVLNLNTNGVGRIYWNESNSLSQPFYALVGSEVRFEAERFNFSIWGTNIADKSFDTFYFMSMGNEFVQCGRPQMFGVNLNINI